MPPEEFVSDEPVASRSQQRSADVVRHDEENVHRRAKFFLKHSYHHATCL
jgi:hypothetical protein